MTTIMMNYPNRFIHPVGNGNPYGPFPTGWRSPPFTSKLSIMSKTNRFRITEEDYVKANKRADREDEIRLHGKQITFRHSVSISRKHYDRNKSKREFFACID